MCSGNIINAKQLADRIITSDKKDVLGQALKFACDRSNKNVVKWLISQTADARSFRLVRIKDDEVTALMAAHIM